MRKRKSKAETVFSFYFRPMNLLCIASSKTVAAASSSSSASGTPVNCTLYVWDQHRMTAANNYRNTLHSSWNVNALNSIWFFLFIVFFSFSCWLFLWNRRTTHHFISNGRQNEQQPALVWHNVHTSVCFFRSMYFRKMFINIWMRICWEYFVYNKIVCRKASSYSFGALFGLTGCPMPFVQISI